MAVTILLYVYGKNDLYRSLLFYNQHFTASV